MLGETWKDLNTESIYSVDSFPTPLCDNYRIRRCKLYHDPAHRGYLASKKRYFWGLKVHVLATAQREPVEVFLTPGSFSDVACLEGFAWVSWTKTPSEVNHRGLEQSRHCHGRKIHAQPVTGAGSFMPPFDNRGATRSGLETR